MSKQTKRDNQILEDKLQRLKEKLGEAEEENKRLKKFAYRDELTGLLNRRGFQDGFGRFSEEAFASQRISERRLNPHKTVSLAFIDVDHFKDLNDVHGHDAGDKALKVLATLLTNSVRHFDFVARWGGEEFVIGLVDANETDATQLVEKIRVAVGKKEICWGIEMGVKKLKLTISAGVVNSDQIRSFEELIRNADIALYEAKNTGRNRVVKHSTVKKTKKPSTSHVAVG